MTEFEDFVAAVEAATGRPGRRNGRNVRLLCPAHDDHDPSLDVAEGEDGRPLVQCRSQGCSFEAIRTAIGFSNGARPEGEWTPHGPAVAVYHYRDEQGRLLFGVCRTAGKQFPARRPEATAKYGWRWNLGNTRRALYRLPELIAAVQRNEPIYVCEGEKDVEAVRRSGAAATCNPHGAGKWRTEYGEHLRGADVRILADRDEEGRSHAWRIAGALDGLAARVIVLEPAEGKDVHDHLRAGRTLAELVPAKGGPHSNGKPPAFALTLEEFISVKDDAPAALLGTDDDTIFPTGGLLILGGKPGVGKTTFAVDAAFHLASGLEWLGVAVERPLRVLLVENEGPREPFRRKLERKRASWPHPLTGVLAVHAWRWGSFSFADPESFLAAKAYLEEQEIDLVIGDPLSRLGVEGVGSPAETTDFVQLLLGLGLFDRVAFLFLHHFRKEPTADEIDELAGAWAAHTDAILVLKEAKGNRIRLSFPKLRWAEQRRPLILAREHESASFSVVAEEGADDRDLEGAVLALLSDGVWRTETEIAKKDGGVGAGRKRVRRILDELTEAGELDYAEGPEGRAPDAKCWRVAQLSEQPEQPVAPGQGSGGCSVPPSLPIGRGVPDNPSASPLFVGPDNLSRGSA